MDGPSPIKEPVRRESDNVASHNKRLRSVAKREKKALIRYITFDPSRPELQNIIKEIDPSGRIKEKESLIKFLAKTYSRPVAETIANFLAKHYLNDFIQTVKPEDYAKGI